MQRPEQRDEVEMLALMLLIRRFEERASQQYQAQKGANLWSTRLSSSDGSGEMLSCALHPKEQQLQAYPWQRIEPGLMQKEHTQGNGMAQRYYLG